MSSYSQRLFLLTNNNSFQLSVFINLLFSLKVKDQLPYVGTAKCRLADISSVCGLITEKSLTSYLAMTYRQAVLKMLHSFSPEHKNIKYYEMNFSKYLNILVNALKANSTSLDEGRFLG